MKSYFAHGDSAQREQPSTCLFESIAKSAISCQCTWTNVLREFGPAKLHRRPERSVHPFPRSTSSVRLFDGTIPWQVYSRNRKARPDGHLWGARSGTARTTSRQESRCGGCVQPAARAPPAATVVGSEEGPEMLLSCGAKAATLQVTRAKAHQ